MAALILRARNWPGQLASSERGQGLVEYALILALVSVVAVAALTGLGGKLVNMISQMTGGL
jgi:Flp pilus assembly pilin Flp